MLACFDTAENEPFKVSQQIVIQCYTLIYRLDRSSQDKHRYFPDPLDSVLAAEPHAAVLSSRFTFVRDGAAADAADAGFRHFVEQEVYSVG